jgi:methylase of polypeptide subunit release factors
MISEIPANEKWDLVVSNPPHSPSLDDTVSHIISEGQPIEAALNAARLIVDSEWSIHKEFMKNIRPYLLPGADVYLIENNKHDFLIDWAGEAGLTYVDTYRYPHPHLNHGPHVIMHFRNI